MKSCEHCEYERSSSCHFPEPQRGGEPPFMAAAALPDARDGGKRCVHFRAPTTINEKGRGE